MGLNMYYNRTLSDDFARYLEIGGKLRWLFDYVKHHKELDFLIGKNKTNECISVYRGLTRIISILPQNSDSVLIDATDTYKNIEQNLYGQKYLNINFQKEIENLITKIEREPKFNRYYINKKEGFYQTELSRRYGICGKADTDFVIIDKEAVIGYSDKAEKNKFFGTLQQKYKELQQNISILNPQRYGKNLRKKAIGNELDFFALDKDGNILLIEYKHGTNTSGIYLSPLQIGLYNDIFTSFPKNKLETAIFGMLEQKQKIGLINPNWKKPSNIKNIIPVLIISDFNYKSSAKEKFNDILNIVRNTPQHGSRFLNNLQTFNFTEDKGLSDW